jgi:hypothetical protein
LRPGNSGIRTLVATIFFGEFVFLSQIFSAFIGIYVEIFPRPDDQPVSAGLDAGARRPGRFTTEKPMAMAERQVIKAKLGVMDLTPPTAFRIGARAGRAAKASKHGHCRPH